MYIRELGERFALSRCPHCRISKPLLSECPFEQSYSHKIPERWRAYICSNCENIVTAKGHFEDMVDEYGNQRRVLLADEVFPTPPGVADELPDSARRYLEQANDSIATAPDGAAILASSAVDAMLKVKGYDNRNDPLFTRIQAAVQDGLLTVEMGKWAHSVRLVSNDLRHTDEKNSHVSPEQAQIVVNFSEALGQFLYVLPSRVAKGITEAAVVDEAKPEV